MRSKIREADSRWASQTSAHSLWYSSQFIPRCVPFSEIKSKSERRIGSNGNVLHFMHSVAGSIRSE